MKRAVAYCLTRNLYPKLWPSLNSLLKNTNVDEVFVLAEDDDVGYPLPEKVTVMNMLGQTYFYADGPNYRSKWTYMALMRVALWHIFPEYDRMLSLDVDTIVEANIDELWDTPLDQHYFAACEEYRLSSGDRLYFNSGVVLWNLKKLRDGMGERLIEEVNTVPHIYPEQDAMNLLCRDHIYQLNSMYNACMFTREARHPKILHFAAIGNWYEAQPAVQKYKEMKG